MYFKTGVIDSKDIPIDYFTKWRNEIVVWNFTDSLFGEAAQIPLMDIYDQLSRYESTNLVYSDFKENLALRKTAIDSAKIKIQQELSLKDIYQPFIANGIIDAKLWFIDIISRTLKNSIAEFEYYIQDFRGGGQCGFYWVVRRPYNAKEEFEYGMHAGFICRIDNNNRLSDNMEVFIRIPKLDNHKLSEIKTIIGKRNIDILPLCWDDKERKRKTRILWKELDTSSTKYPEFMKNVNKTFEIYQMLKNEWLPKL